MSIELNKLLEDLCWCCEERQKDAAFKVMRTITPYLERSTFNENWLEIDIGTLVEEVIKMGADVDYINDCPFQSRYTPIQLAILYNSHTRKDMTSTVATLLRYGASEPIVPENLYFFDINSELTYNIGGYTLMHLAASFGDSKIINALLKTKSRDSHSVNLLADVKFSSKDGKQLFCEKLTPLSCARAAMHANPDDAAARERMQILLANGATEYGVSVVVSGGVTINTLGDAHVYNEPDYLITEGILRTVEAGAAVVARAEPQKSEVMDCVGDYG